MKVHGKKSCRNYAAEIINNGYNVAFLKRQHPSNRFIYSEEETSSVSFEDIVCGLPISTKYSKRRYQNLLYFHCDMSEFSVQ